MTAQTEYDKTADLIESAKVGTSFEVPMRVSLLAARPVTLHCFESFVDSKKCPVKKFKVFSHGVEIKELTATKKGHKWLP